MLLRLIVVLVFVIGMWAGCAMADMETCQVWSEEAYHIADARDKNWEKAKLEEMLMFPLRDYQMTDEVYWKFRILIDTAFENPEKSAGEIERMVYDECLLRLNVGGSG